MGEQDDAEADVHVSRGGARVYDATREWSQDELRATLEVLESSRAYWRAKRLPPNPSAGLWVHQGGRWVRCVCRKCLFVVECEEGRRMGVVE